jgi:triacylglycerol esterase/lipase EstA (alpha/beta hydrolase family)
MQAMRCRRRLVHVTLLLAALALVSACATPIGVTQVDHTAVYRTFTRSALSGRDPSLFTTQVLLRRGLERRFAEEPATVIAELRGSGAGLSPETLFVLAELSFVHAERAHSTEHYLASAVYALAFLGHPEWRAAGLLANAIDPRTRMACDFYNLGLVDGLKAPAREPHAGNAPDLPEVVLTDRTLALPFGELELRTAPETFFWGGYRFSRFIATAEYEVRGLRNRYRQAGVGAPLLAEVTPVATGGEGELARKRIPPRAKVPITAAVRIPSLLDGIATGRLRGTIEIYPADASRTIEINGVRVPLELDPSAALAYMLEGAPVWDTELRGFLRASNSVFGDGLIMMQPYRPGRVPVVLVHGTASSPARWAELVNEVQNDPVLGERVQIWLFNYNTSNPILYSARLLREALGRAVHDFDPSGTDPALHRMVVMGHSQGGLLTRLMVTESGDRFWDAASRVPFAQLRTTPEERAVLQPAMFFEPLPFVTRVVFMSTPHRGSYRASRVALGLVRRIVRLPLRLVQPLENVIRVNPEIGLRRKSLPTAVDNMSPRAPFVRALSESPIAPGVVAHSIIAVEGTGDPRRLSDGVVRYSSAHLEGAASEKVVQSPHSMQAQPETILEVRRILREHLVEGGEYALPRQDATER